MQRAGGGEYLKKCRIFLFACLNPKDNPAKPLEKIKTPSQVVVLLHFGMKCFDRFSTVLFLQNMILKVLIFRFRQLYRMLLEVGLIYIILAALLVFGLLMNAVERLVNAQSPWFGLLGIFIAALIHFQRKDAGFLSRLEVRLPLLYFAEYLILLLPLALLFILGGNYFAAILQTAGLLALGFLQPFSKSPESMAGRLDLKLLPLKAFEARSFLRQYFFASLAGYFLMFALGVFIAPALLAALFVAMAIASFFDEVESKELFEVIHFEKGILTGKVRSYLGLYFVLMAPHALLFLVLHFQYWYLLLAALFVGANLILFNIFYRYAHFSPYRRRVYHAVANSLFLMSVIIPFFYPVTLVYLLIYWLKARKNIKFYYVENN